MNSFEENGFRNSKSYENLKKAWKCILEQYLQKIEDTSRGSPGMNIFVMRNNLKKGLYNCQYMYVDRGGAMWDKYIAFSDLGAKIEERFDPEKMYLVSVHVPDMKNPTQTVGNIRGFLYQDRTEVDF